MKISKNEKGWLIGFEFWGKKVGLKKMQFGKKTLKPKCTRGF